jgi:hypothetical protein
MPSLIGSGIDANYRQQIVPFSRFGSRKIVWFRVGHLDDNSGGALYMGALNAVIDAIQTKGEIVTVGAPYISNNYGKFIVGLFEDTFNNGENIDINEDNPGSGSNSMSETLQQAIRDAVDAGGYDQSYGGVQVQQIYMFGAPWQDVDSNDGWSNNSDYAEPDLKRDFLSGYTQD